MIKPTVGKTYYTMNGAVIKVTGFDERIACQCCGAALSEPVREGIRYRMLRAAFTQKPGHRVYSMSQTDWENLVISEID